MRPLRVIGIVVSLLGVALFLLAGYISDQVESGNKQIAKGQNQVDQVRGASALSPYTKEVGGWFADSNQKKIDAGKEQVRTYDALSSRLRLGGILFFLIGGVLFAVSFHTRNH